MTLLTTIPARDLREGYTLLYGGDEELLVVGSPEPWDGSPTTLWVPTTKGVYAFASDYEVTVLATDF